MKVEIDITADISQPDVINIYYYYSLPYRRSILVMLEAGRLSGRAAPGPAGRGGARRRGPTNSFQSHSISRFANRISLLSPRQPGGVNKRHPAARAGHSSRQLCCGAVPLYGAGCWAVLRDVLRDEQQGELRDVLRDVLRDEQQCELRDVRGVSEWTYILRPVLVRYVYPQSLAPL